MSNGDVYQVRYPKIAGVTPTRFVILDPDADDLVICDLNQMASVNVPQAASAETS